MSVRLLYFASLADHAGSSEEVLTANPSTARAAYEQARAKHDFPFGVDKLRVAINGAFVDWDTAINDGDEVVFIPPVSGG